ncbi:HdeD family acid-resistance protein [Marivita sp. S0852]|uniref:HdeD family acid-resistance protein n=1 Tax=Marivita sp. S0852 TaxID=3373893 RepID=UPI0039822A02
MTELTSYLERNWWLLLIRGIAAILFGIAAFAWPGLTMSVLVLLFGAWTFVDGAFAIADSIRYRDRIDKWWLWLLDGVFGVFVGLLALFMPGVTAFVLLMFIAAWAILGGILRIVAAIQLRKKIEGEWLLGLGGALSILFGVLLIAVPQAGLLSFIWLIAVWSIAIGILFTILAFGLRTVGKEQRL